MRPPEEVKKEIVRQWLARAEQDMKASEALLAAEPPFLYPSCFHAQQASEKYLKALLTWHQIEFPKTHAIEQPKPSSWPGRSGTRLSTAYNRTYESAEPCQEGIGVVPR